MKKLALSVGVILLAIIPVSALKAGVDCIPPEQCPQACNHVRFSPEADIGRLFCGFALSFDSKDDDDNEPGADLLRVPHWVSQELSGWELPGGDPYDDLVRCLDSRGAGPTRSADSDLFDTGVAPKDDSYDDSGFDRGHMAMNLPVKRSGGNAGCDAHTLLSAIPQRPKFRQGIWKDLEYLTAAWAQKYGKVWVIQGPVFYESQTLAWIGDKGERKVAVPDAVFKIVTRDKTADEKNGAITENGGDPEVLAFLYPQLGPGYFCPSDDYRHQRFLTTVEEIEKLTGLDFKLGESVKRKRAKVLWDRGAVDLGQRSLVLSRCRDLAPCCRGAE